MKDYYKMLLLSAVLSISNSIHANTIDFSGTITEDSCSSGSYINDCVLLVEKVNKAHGSQTTIAKFEKELLKYSNETANINIEKIKDNAAVVIAEYY